MLATISLIFSCKQSQIIGKNDTSNFSEEQQLSNTRRLFKIIDSLRELKVAVHKIRPRDKEQMGLTKRWEYKIGRFEITSYGVQPIQSDKTWFTGSIFQIKENNKPFLISGGVSWLQRDIWPQKCDDAFSAKMKMNGIYVDTLKHMYEISPENCSLSFLSLNSGELSLLNRIFKEDSLKRLLLWEYSSTFALRELTDPTYDFDVYKQYKGKMIFDQPLLSSAKTLYSQKKFEELKMLVQTKNVFFNWLAAEALFYYNNRDNFLDTQTIGMMEKYNGKNGFAKFRTDSLLNKVY